MVFFITPFRKRETGWFPFPGMMMIVMLALRVFSAAVFAEPTVAQIEEVGRLMHGAKPCFVL